jgi:tripartite-type tricarboxylate transporter receptor subunit TctC
VRDFAPVALTHNAPRILVVHPSVPAKTVPELIEYIKGRPGKLSFSSAGSGGTNHLSGELFKMMAGVDMVHVPYKGAGPAVADLLAGRIQLTFDSIPVWIPHIKAGKVRALGVTSAQRSATVPDLPTISESGLKGFDVANWLGVFAPTGTPRDIITRLNGELRRIMSDAEVKKQMTEIGVDAMYTTPEELAELVRNDIAKWTKLVKLSGATPD